MKNFLEHIRKTASEDVRLYFSPFRGAVDQVKLELKRPRKNNVRSKVVKGVDLFFAPLIGVRNAVVREWKRSLSD